MAVGSDDAKPCGVIQDVHVANTVPLHCFTFQLSGGGTLLSKKLRFLSSFIPCLYGTSSTMCPIPG